MTLYEKVIAIYPNLTNWDFATVITLRDDQDGRGAYIDRWDHPNLPRPTEGQLAAVESSA